MSLDHILFVGCSTGRVSTLSFSATGSLTVVHATDKAGASPGWLASHPSENVIYAADDAAATVSAFEVAPSCELRLLRSMEAGGTGTVTVDVSPNGRYACCANYADASMSTFSLLTNGTPWPTSLLVHHFTLDGPAPNPEQPAVDGDGEANAGRRPGTDPERQTKSFPHQALYDPTGEFLFVADLGADVIRVFVASETRGTGAVEPLATIPLEAGSGPRHLAFYQAPGSPATHPATHLYVINELSNTLSVFALEYPSAGHVDARLLQTVSTLLDAPPDGYRGFASELAIDRQLGLIYAGNRWRTASDGAVGDIDDTVTVFAIDDSLRTLSPLRSHSLGARNVKHFELEPTTGDWLAVAGKASGTVIVYSVHGWREVARVECEGACVVRWWRARTRR